MKKEIKIWRTSKRITILISIAFMIALMTLGLISAYTWGTQKQGQNVELVMVCPLTGCNLTNITAITYPNSSIAISNSLATHESNKWNYTFTQTSAIGIYKVYGYSTNGTTGAEEYFIGDFEVTATGINQTTSQGIGSAIYLVLMMVLMFTFGVVGFKLFKTENLWVLGMFFVFLSILLLIYNTWLGYEYHRTFTGLSNSSIPETIFYIFLLLLVLGLLVGLTFLFLHWKKVFKYIKREIKQKPSEDKDTEDWDFDEWGGQGSYGK